MNYQNYSLGSNGLFQKSKVPMEGYTLDVEKGDYKKQIDSITGVLSKVEFREFLWEGKTLRFFEVSFQEGDTAHTLSVNRLTQAGNNYSEATRALLSALRDYESGESVTLRAFYQLKEGTPYKDLRCYINYSSRPKNEDGRFPSTGFIPYTEIPKPIVTELLDIKQYNYAEQVAFYDDIFKSVVSKAVFTTPKEKTMLPAANGIPYADYVKSGWSDAQMIDAGLLEASTPEPETPKIVPPAPSLAPPPPAPTGKTPPILKTPPSTPTVVVTDEEELPF